MAELAISAFATQVVGIAELSEDRRIPINVAKPLLPYIAAGNGKKTTWADISEMGDKNEALAVVQTARRPADRISDFE